MGKSDRFGCVSLDRRQEEGEAVASNWTGFWKMKTRQPLPAVIGPGDNRRI